MNIAALHHKEVIACVVVFLFFSLHPFNASGQDNPALTGRLQVGVMNVPPFIMKTVDGQWEGLSIELWRMIARDLELEFELQEYSSIQQVHDALENRVLDIVPTAAVTASREIVLDFSNPYYRSGSAIAVPVESTDFHWFRLAERFFSSTFLQVIGHLTLLLLFVGAVVWMFEHRRNRYMFGERPVEGIGHGV